MSKRTGTDATKMTKSKLTIIREIYDSDNAQDKFESELEDALTSGVETILIEPMKLGDETSRWITVGNGLHKTAVISGLLAVINGFVWPQIPRLYIPCCAVSLAATGIYFISWQNDPCCKYQVEPDPKNIPGLRTLNIGSPVVIVKRDDTRRKYLQTFVSLSAIVVCVVRYRYY